MNCKTLKRNYSARMDGMLPPKEEERLAAHLRDCPNCRSWTCELESAWQMLDDVSEARSTPCFYTRLRARMNSEPQAKSLPRSVRILLPVSATAVLALGIFLGSVVGMNGKGYAAPQSETEWIDALHLDSFDAFPGTSFGEAYFETGETIHPEEGGAP
jgi:predicted anti-sigma-YlaC factor YlaD